METITQSPAQPIRFHGVSKRFALNRSRDRSFVDLLQRMVRRAQPPEYFWPLREVSFDVPRGCTFGIIGENGSGKSTILKLISRILEPTAGGVQINGRVSALLELGAGFHPDLTGRDNIFLNGSLLGFSRVELAQVMDAIIEFADIGPFIDTPVKHYSSGMYARLGFAIAVHVDPDILLVDEVLAVGDENFQRRCLDVIQRLQSQGKTIVIVSHSLSQVAEMCDMGLWLDEGRVAAYGEMQSVVRTYLRSVDNDTAQRLSAENALAILLPPDHAHDADLPTSPPRRWGSGPLRIESVTMIHAVSRADWSFVPQESVRVRIAYHAAAPVPDPVFSVLIHKIDGHYLWASNTADHPLPPITQAGAGTLDVDLPALALTAGRYYLSAAAYVEPDPPHWHTPSDFHEWLFSFQVVSEREIHGDFVMPSTWTHHQPCPVPEGGLTHAIR